MRRTKAVTIMMEPEIVYILQQHEENLSQYGHDLIAADMIARKILTVQDLKRIYNNEEELAQATGS